MEIPVELALITLGGIAAGELYAAFLRPYEHRYNPHWTWATVIGGTVLTWLLFVLLASAGYVGWEAVGWFAYVFLLTGFGILRWQIPKTLRHLREQEQKRRVPKEDARRGGADKPAA